MAAEHRLTLAREGHCESETPANHFFVPFSLLGIFDVNMPLIYGEGDKAFLRLQNAIMQSSYDESIFAWGFELSQDEPYVVLARSPKYFETSKDVVDRQRLSSTRESNFEVTNKGIRYWYPMLGTLRVTQRHWTVSKSGPRLIQLGCEDRFGARIILKVIRIQNNWYRLGLQKYKPNFLERQLHSFAATLLPYRRIQIAATVGSGNMGEIMEGALRFVTLPSATVYRLIVTSILTFSAIVLSSTGADPGSVLRIGLLQMAYEVAPAEVRTVLPPIWILSGLLVDFNLWRFEVASFSCPA